MVRLCVSSGLRCVQRVGLSLFALLLVQSGVEAGAQSIATANVGANQATLQLTSTTSGTGYFTVLNGLSATCGSAAQTKLGQDGTSAVVIHGSLPLTAGVAGNYTVRNLQASTPYTVCFTPDGTTGPISASVTTTAAQDLSAARWATLGSSDFSPGATAYESLAIAPDGAPYVAFKAQPAGAASVMKYSAGSWSTVGAANFSAANSPSVSLAFAPDGTPYVALSPSSSTVAVSKFDGTSWVQVGSNYPVTNPNYLSLAFAPDGMPYLAFADSSSNAMVIRFDGTSWSQAGTALSTAAAYTSLAFAPDGTPYVAFQDGGNSGVASVMAFDGSSWQVVGSGQTTSAGRAYWLSMKFSPTGVPYVAFDDAGATPGSTSAVTLIKYESNLWSSLGSAGTSSLGAGMESLVFAPNGIPYVAFQDKSQSNAATVMSYSGSWTAAGAAGLSQVPVDDLSLAVAPSGSLLIAFSDGSVSGNDRATVMRLKTVPVVSTWPTASAITYGHQLSASTLSGGSANVSGIFSWTDGTVSPTAGSQTESVTFTPDDSTAYTSTTGTATLQVDQATPTLTLTCFSGPYDGNSHGCTTSSTGVGGSTVTGTWDTAASQTLTNAGSLNVMGTFTSTDANYTGGTASGTISISKATATVTLGSLTQTYTGSPRSATETTVPTGLTVDITYNGNSTVPSLVGSYTAVGTVNDANYQGSDTKTLNITQAATALQIAVPTPAVLMGNGVQVTATLSPNAGSDGESVSISDGTNTYTGTLTGGVATIAVPAEVASGTYTLTGAYAGDANLVGANSGPVKETWVAPSVNFGTAAVNANVIQTVSIYVSHAGTLAAANVLTQGIANLDYTQQTSAALTACTASTVYAVGDFCTVQVQFTPKFPGMRAGAVVLKDGAGNVLGSTYLAGTGTGSLPVFSSPSASIQTTGLSTVRGISLDGAGNLYGFETGSGAVDKIAAGTTTLTHVATLGASPAGGATAVDGAGNLFVIDGSAGAIYEFPGGAAPAVQVASVPESDDNLLVDGAGNLYFSGASTGAIYELKLGASQVSTLVPGNQNHRFVGIALDQSGNLYAADFTNSVLYEVAAGTSNLVQVPTDSNLSQPHAVAVDPAGNVYVTNYTGSQVVFYGAGATTGTLLPETGQTGITLDGAGNLFTITGGGTITSYTRALSTPPAPSVSFTAVAQGGTSPDSPKTVSLVNIGNTSLNFTSISYPTDFPVNSSDASLCSISTPLSINASCDFSMNFIPQSVASLNESVAIHTNGGNGSVALSGVGLPKPLVIVTPSTLSFGNQSQGLTSQLWHVDVKNNSSSSPLDSIVPTINQTQPAGGSNFTILNNTCTGTPGHGITVAPNTSCGMDITFTPTNTQNASDSYAATLSIADDGLDNQGSEPQLVPMTGTGTGIHVFLAPDSLVFANSAINAPTQQTVTLDNASNATLSIATIGIVETGTPFTVVSGGTCQAPGTLAGNSTCTIVVQYQPTTVTSGSGDHATLKVTDNSSSGPGQQSIPLSGTAQGNALIISPSSLDFTNTPVSGTAGPSFVTVTNNGSGPSNVTAVSLATTQGGGNVFTRTAGTCIGASFHVPAGGSCTIGISFTPTTVTTYGGQLQVTADGATQTIPIHGTADALNVVLSPNALTFNAAVGTTSAAQTLTLTNNSNTALQLGAISDTNGSVFQIAGGASYCQPGGTLAANASCTIAITFAPAAAQTYSDTLTVTEINGGGLTQTATLSGTSAYPTAALSPSPLDFGSVVETTSSIKTITLTNTGSYALTMTAAPLVSGTGFTLSSTTCAANQTIAAGGSCSIAIQFAPTAVASYTGQVQVFDSASGGSQTASLTGSGSTDVPSAALAPNSITFSSQTIGSTGNPWTMTLNNTSSIPMSNVAFALSTGSPFVITSNACGTTLAAHSTCTLRVAFSPSATLTAPLSQLTDTLQVTYSGTAAGSIGSVSAAFYGTPTLPAILLSPSSRNFGNVTVGANSNDQTVTIQNISAGPVNFTGFSLGTTNFAVDATATSCSTSVALAAHQSCTVSIYFAPPASVSSSTAFNDTLTVSFKPGQTQTVSLSATATSGVPNGQLSPSTITFPNQTVGSAGNPWVVTLSNMSSIPMYNLTVSVTNSAFRIASTGCSTSLAAYSTCSMQVEFNPQVGTPLSLQTGSLVASFVGNLSNVAGSSGTLSTSLQGLPIAPTVSVSPSSLDFGSVAATTTSTKQVTVTNTSSGPVFFSSIATRNANSIFTVSSNPAVTTCSTAATLQPGASCTVGVVFAPGQPLSTTTFPNDGLVITSTAQNSPQSVTLMGTGTVSANYVIAVNPQSLTLKAGQSGTVTFTMQPTGGFSGSVALGCGNLPAGVSCSFSPSALTADGANTQKSSVLTIKTDTTTHASLASGQDPTRALAGMMLLPGLAGGAWLAWRRRKLTTRAKQWLALLLLGTSVAAAVTGCGANITVITPPGSSQLSVTATTAATTSGSSADASKSVSFTLIVTN